MRLQASPLDECHLHPHLAHSSRPLTSNTNSHNTNPNLNFNPEDQLTSVEEHVAHNSRSLTDLHKMTAKYDLFCDNPIGVYFVQRASGNKRNSYDTKKGPIKSMLMSNSNGNNDNSNNYNK